MISFIFVIFVSLCRPFSENGDRQYFSCDLPIYVAVCDLCGAHLKFLAFEKPFVMSKKNIFSPVFRDLQKKVR